MSAWTRFLDHPKNWLRPLMLSGVSSQARISLPRWVMVRVISGGLGFWEEYHFPVFEFRMISFDFRDPAGGAFALPDVPVFHTIPDLMDANLTKAINRLAEAHEKGCERIADSLECIANRLKDLGNGNAATQCGAIEGLGMAIKDAMSEVAESIRKE